MDPEGVPARTGPVDAASNAAEGTAGLRPPEFEFSDVSLYISQSAFWTPCEPRLQIWWQRETPGARHEQVDPALINLDS